MARERRSSYSQWVKRFLVIFLALLAVVALFNVLADGSGVFRLNKGLKQVALSLLSGHMVAGRFSTFDERELQRQIIERYGPRRDMVLIGSSRTMSLRKGFIPGNPDFFNHSTSGTVLGDMVSIIGLYRNKGMLPKTVIFGIDPWIFNKDNGLGKPWQALAVYYRDMMKEMADRKAGAGPGKKDEGAAPVKIDRMARFLQLINLDYTIQNWESLWRGDRMRVTDTIEVDDFVREPDGSLHFPYKNRHSKMIKDGQANAMPDMYFKEWKTLYGTEILEDLVDYLQSRGVRVVFLLPPFHAHAFRSCFENPAKYGITLKVEEYLRDLARRKHVTVVGSYDPAPYGFKGEDFFDGTHGHPIVMKTLFATFK